MKTIISTGLAMAGSALSIATHDPDVALPTHMLNQLFEPLNARFG